MEEAGASSNPLGFLVIVPPDNNVDICTGMSWGDDTPPNICTGLSEIGEGEGGEAPVCGAGPEFEQEEPSLELFLDLPSEIWLHILSFLSPKCLSVLSLVSRHWNELACDPLLWRSKCMEFFGVSLLHDSCNNAALFWKQAYINAVRRPSKIQDNTEKMVRIVRLSDFEYVHTGFLGGNQAFLSETPFSWRLANRPPPSEAQPFTNVFATTHPVRLSDGKVGHKVVWTNCHYYEVTLSEPSEHIKQLQDERRRVRSGYNESCVAVGLGLADFPICHRMPGWNPCSVGYHSDDGKFFSQHVVWAVLCQAVRGGRHSGLWHHIAQRSVFYHQWEADWVAFRRFQRARECGGRARCDWGRLA